MDTTREFHGVDENCRHFHDPISKGLTFRWGRDCNHAPFHTLASHVASDLRLILRLIAVGGFSRTHFCSLRFWHVKFSLNPLFIFGDRTPQTPASTVYKFSTIISRGFCGPDIGLSIKWTVQNSCGIVANEESRCIRDL